MVRFGWQVASVVGKGDVPADVVDIVDAGHGVTSFLPDAIDDRRRRRCERSCARAGRDSTGRNNPGRLSSGRPRRCGDRPGRVARPRTIDPRPAHTPPVPIPRGIAWRTAPRAAPPDAPNSPKAAHRGSEAPGSRGGAPG